MKPRCLFVGVAALVVLTVGLGSHRTLAGSGDQDQQVVVRVGLQTVTVGELERRLATIPRFQLATLGQTQAEIKRAFLEKVLVPECLHAQAALARGLDRDPEVRLRERDALKSAMLLQVRNSKETREPIGDEEVRRYFEGHRHQYDSPPRYAIWRALLTTRDEANAVLAEVQKDRKAWNEIVRQKSIDKSTNLRGGNLGFVTDSGDSSDGKLRVDPAIVEAAKGVKDDQIVDHPVSEGGGFSVVWRRASVPEVRRSLQQEQDNIRRLIARDRVQAAQEKLLKTLRDRDVGSVDTAVLDHIEVSSNGQISPRGMKGRVVRKPGMGRPEATPRGLR